jgi:hypothetical protein
VISILTGQDYEARITVEREFEKAGIRIDMTPSWLPDA